jgi:hypothetical protein
VKGSRHLPENPESLKMDAGRVSALLVFIMKYTEFKNITYHTPLSEDIREKIAKAYGKGERTVIVNDITIQDAKVLTNLGYNIKHRNKKMEIQL